MSRTYRHSKSPGHDFMSRRKGNPANGHGKIAKQISHRAERKFGEHQNQLKRIDFDVE